MTGFFKTYETLLMDFVGEFLPTFLKPMKNRIVKMIDAIMIKTPHSAPTWSEPVHCGRCSAHLLGALIFPA